MALVQQRLSLKDAALPFVISTGAKRSGEICGSAVPSWKCFQQTNHGPSLTQGDEKRPLFSNDSPLKTPPFPLSSRPERSAVERSAVQRSLLGNVFQQRPLSGSFFLETLSHSQNAE